MPTVTRFGSGSVGANLTASATANVKGAWVEITAAIPHACVALKVTLGSGGATSAAGTRYAVDVGTGAAGAEVVRVPDMMHQNTAGNAFAFRPTLTVLISVANGVRLAARCQASVASSTISCDAHGWDSGWGGMQVSTVADTYTLQASTQGLELEPGASANAKGLWVALTTSMTNAAGWMSVVVAKDVDIAGTPRWLVDIGSGAAGAEVVQLPDLPAGMTSSDVMSPAGSIFDGPTPAIAAATRLAARCACSITTATERLLDVLVTTTERQDPATGGGLRTAGRGGLAMGA